MNVNYELYKIFFVVANSKTITEAAKKLFISQPAVTKSINNLEKQLNTILFIRNTKGTKLTKSGKELYEQIKPAIEQILKAEQQLSLKQNEKQKKLTIGVNDPFLQQYFVKALKNLTFKDNDIIVCIREQETNLMLSEMRDEKIDLIVTTLNNEDVDKNNFEITQVAKLHFCIIENAYSKTVFNHKNLTNSKVICKDESIVNKICPNHQNIIIVDNYYQIYELVAQNVGLGIIPAEFVNNYLKDNKVDIIKENIATADIYLIANKIFHNSYATRLKKLIIESVNVNKHRQTVQE